MNKVVIIGAGPAGLLAGYFMQNSVVLDRNPMGQINSAYQLGPRFLKTSNEIDLFLFELGVDCSNRRIVNVGYINEDDSIATPNQDFLKAYALHSRGTEKVEKSFMSGFESNFEVYGYDDNFYVDLFEKLSHIVKIRKQNVETIDIHDKVLTLDNNDKLEYDKLFSTLNLNLFYTLIGKEFPFKEKPYLPKSFIVTKKEQKSDVELSKKFDYVYSLKESYTRKTYVKDYIVYELKETSFENETDIFEGNTILKRYLNLPFQIKNSLNIGQIESVYQLGRYAEVNHSVKAEEIIKRFKNGQYN